MAKWVGGAVAAIVLVSIGVALGGGGSGGSGDSTTDRAVRASPTPASRGVATVASDLATICVDRLTNGHQGDPATTKIETLVDELLEAYENGPKNEGTTHIVRVAADNMRDGCGSDQESRIRAALDAAGVPPSEQSERPPAADPKGTYKLSCDYTLGDFGDSGDPAAGYRFIAGGTVKNTGNVGIAARVRITWEQLGTEPIRWEKTYRIETGKTKRVKVTLPATEDQIDLHQSADGDCATKVKIIDHFGTPEA